MDARTARHLNSLHDAARPLTLDESYYIWYRLPDGSLKSGAPKLLQEQCIQAAMRSIPTAQAEEIRAAASASRLAAVYDPAEHSIQYEYARHPVCIRACQLARPEAEAIIQTHHEAAVRAYEAYRIACEQGVAVPPSE